MRGDRTAFALAQGDTIITLEAGHQSDTMATVGRAVRLIEETKARSIRVDDTGVGGGVTDRLYEVQDHNINGLAVVYLDIPDEVALARMQNRGRVDDRKGFGKERLRQFRSNISSLLEFYKGARFLTVDTTKEVSAVASEIVAFLGSP